MILRGGKLGAYKAVVHTTFFEKYFDTEDLALSYTPSRNIWWIAPQG